jgi:hypothetical protein
VMPARFQPVQLAIKHVCDCCEGMPVFRVNMRECPRNIAQTDTTGDPGILIDVLRIIIVNEIVPECLTKHGPGENCQTDANADDCPLVSWFPESA